MVITVSEERWFWRAGERLKEFNYSADTPTSREDVSEYEHVTVFFKTDTAGTLTIFVDDPDGDSHPYATYSPSAGECVHDTLPSAVDTVFLRFDTDATVTAWLELGKEG